MCGSYELLVELASGGMATVFLARAKDGRDAPLVAIKRPHRHLAKDKVYLSMLVDEARLASAIQHDNVVRVRELGFVAGEPFVVMDYVEGASLADIRRELTTVGRALDARVTVRIALHALAGLQAAHILHDDAGKPLGIIHRDVSPHNVLVGCDGASRLTDFGIAKAADRVQVTKTHEVKGKLAYLAPERIDKRRICNVQSDVFSMAVVIWECLAGRRLFRGEEAIETLQEVMTAPIPSLRKIGAPISEALDNVIMRGLARDLDRRYGTAAEFADALEKASGRANIATPAEVVRLVEALFGERLRVRHSAVKEVLGGDDGKHVLEVSGLSYRPEPTPEIIEREKKHLESIAPPAPSARYAFAQGSDRFERVRRLASSPRAIALGAGGALAAILLAAVFTRPSVSPAVAAGPAVAVESPIRRVVVPLPFAARVVVLDDQTRTIEIPTDVVAFDVPRTSGTRHRVVAEGVDGARVESYVLEANGIARPEGAGFVARSARSPDPKPDPKEEPPAAAATNPSAVLPVAPPVMPPVVMELPSTPSPAVVASIPRIFPGPSGHAKARTVKLAGPLPSAKPGVGTVKDGFTKLR